MCQMLRPEELDSAIMAMVKEYRTRNQCPRISDLESEISSKLRGQVSREDITLSVNRLVEGSQLVRDLHGADSVTIPNKATCPLCGESAPEHDKRAQAEHMLHAHPDYVDHKVAWAETVG